MNECLDHDEQSNPKSYQHIFTGLAHEDSYLETVARPVHSQCYTNTATAFDPKVFKDRESVRNALDDINMSVEVRMITIEYKYFGINWLNCEEQKQG
jgi:hypothetical protein